METDNLSGRKRRLESKPASLLFRHYLFADGEKTAAKSIKFDKKFAETPEYAALMTEFSEVIDPINRTYSKATEQRRVEIKENWLDFMDRCKQANEDFKNSYLDEVPLVREIVSSVPDADSEEDLPNIIDNPEGVIQPPQVKFRGIEDMENTSFMRMLKRKTYQYFAAPEYEHLRKEFGLAPHDIRADHPSENFSMPTRSNSSTDVVRETGVRQFRAFDDCPKKLVKVLELFLAYFKNADPRSSRKIHSLEDVASCPALIADLVDNSDMKMVLPIYIKAAVSEARGHKLFEPFEEWLSEHSQNMGSVREAYESMENLVKKVLEIVGTRTKGEGFRGQ